MSDFHERNAPAPAPKPRAIQPQNPSTWTIAKGVFFGMAMFSAVVAGLYLFFAPIISAN